MSTIFHLDSTAINFAWQKSRGAMMSSMVDSIVTKLCDFDDKNAKI